MSTERVVGRTTWVWAVLPALLALCASAHAWPTVPLPADSRGEAVSRHMKYNGLDMRASRFSTPATVEEVVAFYAAKWPGRHVVDELDGKTIVGHADGAHYVTVELAPSGGGTEGTVGIIRLPRDGQVPELGKGFYVPAGTEVLSDIVHLDMPRQTRTLVLSNGLSPYVNQLHYSRHLRGEGWKASRGSACRPSERECVASFEHPSGGRMMLTMTRGDGIETGTVVNIE